MAEDNKIHDGKKEEKKTEEQKKPEKAKVVETKVKTEKKNEAIVNGRDLPISIKHAVAICNHIKGKDIDHAIAILEEVVKMKKAVPMRGEIPHRRGMMSGRYPVKAAGFFIRLLKSLKSNAIVNELEIEKYEIHCIPNVAPRPYKRFGQGRFKRSHVTIKLVPRVKKNK
ncbi:50S ribosomal protein L22 [uncultured archaeon]|nr:50S ribosomal protein L22 [uncultured archaeon]